MIIEIGPFPINALQRVNVVDTCVNKRKDNKIIIHSIRLFKNKTLYNIYRIELRDKAMSFEGHVYTWLDERMI